MRFSEDSFRSQFRALVAEHSTHFNNWPKMTFLNLIRCSLRPLIANMFAKNIRLLERPSENYSCNVSCYPDIELVALLNFEWAMRHAG